MPSIAISSLCVSHHNSVRQGPSTPILYGRKLRHAEVDLPMVAKIVRGRAGLELRHRGSPFQWNALAEIR